MEKNTIDEMIAEAIAEEEANTVISEFERPLEIPKNTKEVTINLADYVSLKNMMQDYSRIMYAITKDMKLSYSKEYLVIDGSEIMRAMQVLYPSLCDSRLDELKAEEDN